MKCDFLGLKLIAEWRSGWRDPGAARPVRRLSPGERMSTRVRPCPRPWERGSWSQGVFIRTGDRKWLTGSWRGGEEPRPCTVSSFGAWVHGLGPVREHRMQSQREEVGVSVANGDALGE